ncbi:hypothetical protein HZB94_00955 [Candidatus Falkowbacteria bacterium]|nr:hypothetical protein [Candidatus Falkowbacteria bacterium]
MARTKLEIIDGPSKWDGIFIGSVVLDKTLSFNLKADADAHPVYVKITGAFWQLANFFPQRNDMNEVLLVCGNVENEDDRKWIEKKLEVSDSRWAGTFVAVFNCRLRSGWFEPIFKPIPTQNDMPEFLRILFETVLFPLACPSEEQIRQLKAAIINSKDSHDFAKKTILWLIEKSQRLTKSVALSFIANVKQGRFACFGVHDMVSANCTTHLDRVLKNISTKMYFWNHADAFKTNGKEFAYGNNCYTVWLSREMYDKNPDFLFFDSDEVLAEIEAIELTP